MNYPWLGKNHLPLKIKIPIIVFSLLVAFAVVLHLTLSQFLLRFANKKLNEIPGYRGHISEIDVNLLRGAYTAKKVRLEKVDGKIPVPFFSATAVDLSVEWRALFHGKLVSEIDLVEPHLNFVSGPTPQQSQTGIDTIWQQKVEDLFPIRINHFGIRGGEIHFRDFHQNPKVDIHLDHLEADVSGLTNSSKTSKLLPSTVHITGRVMDQASLRLDMKLAPLAASPTFDLDAEMKDLELTRLNDYFRAYVSADAKGGTIGLYTEMTASQGRFKGYVKPLAKDIKILGPEDKKKNPLHQLWEATLAGVVTIFENRTAAQVGTQIPFSGSFSNPNAAIWATVSYLLRNAFVEALKPQLNNSIRFGDAMANAKKPLIVEDPKKKKK